MGVNKAVAGLSAVCVALALVVAWQQAVIQEQSSQVRLARVQVENDAKMARTQAAAYAETSIEEQRRCADSARQTYTALGYNSQSSPLATFSNHYSSREHRCFLSITNTKDATVTLSLTDAVENKVYGIYLWVNSSDKPYDEVKPSVCWVQQENGLKRSCKSEDEFSALIKSHMEG